MDNANKEIKVGTVLVSSDGKGKLAKVKVVRVVHYTPEQIADWELPYSIGYSVVCWVKTKGAYTKAPYAAGPLEGYTVVSE